MKENEITVSRSVPYMKLAEMKPNEKNPRTITEDDFQILKNSIIESPSYMELRPIILDKFGVIQGGNQRYKACLELKLTEVPFDVYTEERYQKDLDARKKLAKKKGIKYVLQSYTKLCREFVIKDNLNAGKFDNEMLIEEWELEELRGWGADVFVAEETDLTEFFEEGQGEGAGASTKIILDYSEEDFNLVSDRLNSMDGTKEQIIFKLLQI